MPPPFDPWLESAIGAEVALATHADADALASRQAQRLAELLRVASRDSAWHRRRLAGVDPTRVRLQDLPVSHRGDLMREFDAWVTDPALRIDALRRFTANRSRIAEPYLGRYMVWESSGSSGGEPGVYVQDARSMAVHDALEAQRRRVMRPLQRLFDPWGLLQRMAFVGAVAGHFASNVSVERLRRLNPALARTMHSVSFLQPLAQLVDELQALAPTVIATYPSAAVLLAEEQDAGRLNLRLQEVWTGGETLTPAMRAFVAKAFGCPVANSYGASEFLSIAFECRLGSLHLSSDWVILESVDERGIPVPGGQAGTTCLLTNLANHVQPLIRYDLGDRITLHAQRCSCGSALPVIEVVGRCDDTLCLAVPGARAVRVLPLALSTVLEDDAGLFDFQLVQTGPAELLLRTGLSGTETSRVLRRARMALTAFLASHGAPGVHIRCRSGEPGRCGRSGKLQRVIGLPP